MPCPVMRVAWLGGSRGVALVVLRRHRGRFDMILGVGVRWFGRSLGGGSWGLGCWGRGKKGSRGWMGVVPGVASGIVGVEEGSGLRSCWLRRGVVGSVELWAERWCVPVLVPLENPVSQVLVSGYVEMLSFPLTCGTSFPAASSVAVPPLCPFPFQWR